MAVEHSKAGGDLDPVDREILAELQRDGRLSVAELARRVSLTATPCFERVRRLERAGYIKDYAARLDPERLGFAVLAFIEVSLDRTTPDVLERFRLAVRELDEVLECHMVAGGFEYLLKVRAVSTSAFRHFLAERLNAIPGLQRTHTYLVLEEVKSTTALPLGQPVRRRASARRRPAER